MSTETAKTTEQGEWVLAYDDGKLLMLSLKHLLAVRVDLTRGYASTDNDIVAAMRDPARVYRVDAYPQVIEQLERAKNWIRALETEFGAHGFTDRHDDEGTCRCIADSCESALALVHPAEEVKT